MTHNFFKCDRFFPGRYDLRRFILHKVVSKVCPAMEKSKMMNVVWCVLGVAVVMILLIFVFRKPHDSSGDNDASTGVITENYGVVSGAVGPYRKEITECAARCNASDARSRLLGAYNIGCHQYCENLFTEKARDYAQMSFDGVKKPNDGVSPDALKQDFKSTLDVCNERCGVDVDFLDNYSPSDIPPPFPLMPDGNIVQPIDNPGYVRSNLKRNQQRRCVNDCVGKYNVAKYCATMTCPYSLLPTDTCMERCIATRSTDNLNGSWTWDINNV